jgi:hypothetical protein
MDPATIIPANITLVETVSGNPVARNVTYTEATKSALVDPVADLAPGLSYTVTVTTAVTDAGGVALAAPVAIVFTTGALPDVTAPTFGGAVSAVAENAFAITVSWVAATDDVDPSSSIVYLIYVATASGTQNFAAPPAATTLPGATSHTLGGLLAATTYYFVVRARDSSGNTETNMVEVNAPTATTPRSWLNDVWTPIFVPRCQSCHTSGSGSGTVSYSSAATAYANLVNVPAVACAPLDRVEPFNSAQSVLYRKVSGTSCGSQMPLGGPFLNAAEIDAIKDWIDEGAPNN